MHKKHKHDIIAVLAILGFGISLYLAITHYFGFAVPCSITHGCEVVLSSKYSMFLGFPLSVWGVAYFIAIICLLKNRESKRWRSLLGEFGVVLSIV